MKTKHFYILVILLASFLSSTTTVQAQTKEETIAWIKEKIKKNIPPSNGWKTIESSFIVNECSIIISYKRSFKEISWSDYYERTYTFPVVPSIEVISASSEYVDIYPDRDGYLIHVKTRSFEGSKELKNEEEYAGHFRIINGEPNFAERLQKALRHLASFCEENKETF